MNHPKRLLVFGLVAGLLTFAACGSGERSPSDASAGAEGSGDNEVVMRLIAYKPQTVQVLAGTSVVWKQQDAGFHTVTSGTVRKDASGSTEPAPSGMFDSGRLAKGERFTFTFDDAGTYEYFCEIHPATMSGRVEVQ